MRTVAARQDTPTFGTLVKHWRLARRMSQLTLALEAEISARHLSFLETGRAQPSRDMVLLLTSVLDVPLRERNAFLVAAGYAPVYQERSLAAPELAHVQRALDCMLHRQEPYPGLVLDQHWNVVRHNAGAARMFQYFLEEGASEALGPPNVMRLTFHPQGFRPFIVNWEALAGQLIQRLHREVTRALPGEGAPGLLEELLAYPGVPRQWHRSDPSIAATPLLPLTLQKGEVWMSFLTTMATLGTPQDITLEELRIECFFPADQTTEDAVQHLTGGEKTQTAFSTASGPRGQSLPPAGAAPSMSAPGALGGGLRHRDPPAPEPRRASPHSLR
jgi:transcriptional regulator with XRE-family HTH domain